MKKIKILHLFPKLLSLYGEYGNVTILARTLQKNGFEIEITEYEGGELTIDADFVYIGSGTEQNLAIALRGLKPYANDIGTSVENGKTWLATGNALTLFAANSLGTFDFTFENGKRRITKDILTDEKNPFGEKLVGFINSFAVFGGVKNHVFNKENFYGTDLIGPFLVKNPAALEKIATTLAETKIIVPKDDNLRKAYQTALAELGKK